jgi:MFS family permease
VITGCMNTLGNLGGLLGPLVVGIAVDRWHSWTFPFYVTAIIYACGACAWLAIDPNLPLARPTVGLPGPGSEQLRGRADV